VFLAWDYTYVKGGFAGEDLPGVHEALPYLISNINRELDLDKGEAASSTCGISGVVLGGGDTGMDASTAVRQGASSVTCTYRRDEDNSRGRGATTRTARKRASPFYSISSPLKSSARSSTGREIDRHAFGPRTAWAPHPGNGSGTEEHRGRRVIIAFDFYRALPIVRPATDRAARNARARIGGGAAFQTTIPRCSREGHGARVGSGVTAVFEGREAAQGIMRYLGCGRVLRTKPSSRRSGPNKASY